MRLDYTLLPSSLIALLPLITSSANGARLQWPQRLSSIALLGPRSIKLLRRLEEQTPTSIRKMSQDQGEMFHWEYWGFDDTDNTQEVEAYSNGSVALPRLNAPLLLHDSLPHLPPRHEPRTLLLPNSAHLQKRSFQCPAGTNSCANIGADYGCCPSGTTCQLGSSGNLGCCPGSSASCAGDPPTACESGYAPCPAFHGGGGCCLDGFSCQSEGCVAASTTVVVVNPVVTVTASPSTVSSSTPASTTSSPPPPSSTTITSSSTPTSTSSPSSSPPPQPTTTPAISAPVLPTSVAASTITSTSPITSILTPCPTGFYQCSAFYNAGSCCQVGRDCGLTSCPPQVTNTALVSNGVTIAGVVASGVCASGWYTCGANVGGGCCPSGFGCGSANCSATATATETVAGSVVTPGAVVSAVAKENGGTRLKGRSRWVVVSTIITAAGIGAAVAW